MSNDTEFVNGMIFKAPNDGAPDFVKAKLSIKRQELIDWLNTKDGDWINADVKVSNGGKWYCAVDNWKPNSEGGTSGSRAPVPQREPRQAATSAPVDEFQDDDIPF